MGMCMGIRGFASFFGLGSYPGDRGFWSLLKWNELVYRSVSEWGFSMRPHEKKLWKLLVSWFAFAKSEPFGLPEYQMGGRQGGALPFRRPSLVRRTTEDLAKNNWCRGERKILLTIRTLVRGGPTRPHRPRLAASHSTLTLLSAHSFYIGPAVINNNYSVTTLVCQGWKQLQALLGVS